FIFHLVICDFFAYCSSMACLLSSESLMPGEDEDRFLSSPLSKIILSKRLIKRYVENKKYSRRNNHKAKRIRITSKSKIAANSSGKYNMIVIRAVLNPEHIS